MKRKFDNITVTERDEGTVLRLPDGSSVEVPQATIRRSAVLQEGINTCDMDTNVSVTLPQGVLQDWLQSVDALNAAAISSEPSTDIANDPRLLRFLKVSVCLSVSPACCLGKGFCKAALCLLLLLLTAITVTTEISLRYIGSIPTLY